MAIHRALLQLTIDIDLTVHTLTPIQIAELFKAIHRTFTRLTIDFHLTTIFKSGLTSLKGLTFARLVSMISAIEGAPS